MRRAMLALAAVALAATSCRGPDDAAVSGPRLVPLGGDLLVVRGDETVAVEEPLVLSPGDLVRSGADGGARIEWPGGQTLEIARDTQLGLEDTPVLIAGSALVNAGPGLAVSAGAARVEGAENGIFRMDRTAALRIGVYEGSALVPDSGWERAIGPLRQAFVVALAGTIPEPPEPLRLDAEDPWDLRLLGDAIDLGLRVADLQRGLATRLRGRPEVVESVLKGDIPLKTLRNVLRSISPAEVVVASEAAILAAKDGGDRPDALLRRILDFRASGATWPVVVAEWDLLHADLVREVARITQVIARLLRPPAGVGGGPDGAGPIGGGTPTTGGTPPGDGGGPPGGGPPGGGPPGGGPPDPPDPPEEPPPPCNDPVECLLEDVLDTSREVTKDAGLD